jgi:hypothetical protein
LAGKRATAHAQSVVEIAEGCFVFVLIWLFLEDFCAADASLQRIAETLQSNPVTSFHGIHVADKALAVLAKALEFLRES